MLRKLRISSIRGDYVYFITARLGGIALKPLLLSLFLILHLETVAAQISQLFLALSGVLILYSVPIHFDFYKLVFEDGKKFYEVKKRFQDYILQLYLHCVLITPLTCYLVFLLTKDLTLTIGVLLALVVDKIFDEIQRFLQFSKSFNDWSSYFLLKNIIPFFAVICAMPFVEETRLIYIYILSMVVVTLGLSRYYTPKVIRVLIFKVNYRFNFTTLKQYWQSLKKTFGPRYIQGICSGNIATYDKWIASMLYHPLFLSELMVIYQFSNCISIGVSNLAIAHRRKELLSSDNTLRSLFVGWKLAALVGALLLTVYGVLAVYSAAFYEFREFGIMMLILVPLGTASIAFSEPLREYLFWNISVRYTLLIDILFFILVGSLAAVFKTHYYLLPAFFLFGAVIRTLALVILVKIVSQRRN